MAVCEMRRREDGRIVASIYDRSSSITGVRVGGRDQCRCQNLCKDRAALFPTLSPRRRIGTFWYFPLIAGVRPHGTPGNGSFSAAGQITRFRPAPEIVANRRAKSHASFQR